jgi:tetratricopeptide (TPR) repeat protein
LNRAVKHLRLFNVCEFVVLHETTEQAASLHPEFVREREFPPFKVFRLGSDEYGYVVPLEYKPIFVRTNEWKRLFFHWFRLSPNRVFLALERGGKLPVGYQSFSAEELDLRLLPAEPFGYGVNLRETVRSKEILIETDRVGHPLLIKVSFHPNWHVEGAEVIHLASPGFMLVFPEQENIRVYYGPGTPNTIGWICTVLGLVLLLMPFRFPCGPHSLGLEIKWRWIALLILIIPPAVYGLLTHYDAHTLYQKGLKHFHKQDYDGALSYFEKGVEKFPYSPAIDGTYFFYGLCHYKKEDWQRALDIWLRFLEDYPEARTMDEVLYHIGQAYRLLGKEHQAEEAFNELKRKFPGSRFAELVQ